MTQFETTGQINDLVNILTNTVGPRTYYLHNSVGGSGWKIINPAGMVKTIVVDDDQLAVFLRLKLK